MSRHPKIIHPPVSTAHDQTFKNCFREDFCAVEPATSNPVSEIVFGAWQISLRGKLFPIGIVGASAENGVHARGVVGIFNTLRLNVIYEFELKY